MLIEGDLEVKGDVHVDDNLFIYNIKTGANQGAAGADAGELWATDTHISLPDNTILIGV